jgi:3D (Asp-Asp-Asp) domain-containing protein
MMRILSRSLWRKLLATFIAILGFVLFYEATTFDSRDLSSASAANPTGPVPGSRVQFAATAYCKGTTTTSGVGVRTGIAAADPVLLPVGSVINVTTDDVKYNGIYTIMDTGPKVQGRMLDVYIWSCYEALAFGRKEVQVTILRLGWSPGASTPSLIDRLFRRRSAARTETGAAGVTASDAKGPTAGGSDSGEIISFDTSPPAGSDSGLTAPSDPQAPPQAPASSQPPSSEQPR